MKLAFDDFEKWIRERSQGCMEQGEIENLCKGNLDFTSGDYTYFDQGMQAQWEAWQASTKVKIAMLRDLRDELDKQPRVELLPDNRDRDCIERWPGCESGCFDYRCCRFPKSCSCG